MSATSRRETTTEEGDSLFVSMHEYDIALKDLLVGLAKVTLRELTGLEVNQWRDVELPEVSNPRMDLLGETDGGRLVHIELQSTNDDRMAVRMADYALRVYRMKRIYPVQVALYVGEAPLRMSDSLDLPALKFHYRLVDIRDLDGDRLLGSDAIGDNIIGILAVVRDRHEAIRRVLSRIVALDPSRRPRMLRLLMILAGLRSRMGLEIEEESKRMPILNDINEHEVLGREFRRGVQQGVQQGIQQGVQQGAREGELKLLRIQLERRFGPLPKWAQQRLEELTLADFDRLAPRVVDAADLNEFFE